MTREELERRRSNSLAAAARPAPQRAPQPSLGAYSTGRASFATARGGPEPQQQPRPQQRSLGAYDIGQSTRQALGATASTVYGPYRAAGRAIGGAASGAMNFGRGLLGMEQPQATDSAVGAQPGPTLPQTRGMAQAVSPNEPPQNRTFSTATGRDANPPSLGQRALANRLGGADITQGPAGSQRQVQGGRTRYAGLGGTAEFQGTPREQGMSVFGGARTNAAAQRSLADYRSRGLDQFGNDMNAIGQLNQTADRMRAANQEQLSSLRASREANAREAELGGLRSAMQRASFSDVEDDQRRGEMAERRLAQLGAISPQQDLYSAQQGLALQRQGLQQQGAQAQSQAQAAAQQQGIENQLDFERLGLDREKFNQQVEQDGRVDPIALSQEIAETYDPINAPQDAEGNPVDRQTYIRDTMNAMFQAIGKVIGPDGTAYNAGEIQALADARFGGDVEKAKDDMRAQGFLGV